MTSWHTLLGTRALDIVLAAGRQPHARWTPTQVAVVLEALGHPHLRDAILAQLLDHPHAAQALAGRQPVDVTWLTDAHRPEVVDRAQATVDHLEPAARVHGGDTRDAVGALRAFLFWSQDRPSAALAALAGVTTSYGLGKLVRQLLAMGIQPLVGGGDDG